MFREFQERFGKGPGFPGSSLNVSCDAEGFPGISKGLGGSKGLQSTFAVLGVQWGSYGFRWYPYVLDFSRRIQGIPRWASGFREFPGV